MQSSQPHRGLEARNHLRYTEHKRSRSRSRLPSHSPSVAQELGTETPKTITCSRCPTPRSPDMEFDSSEPQALSPLPRRVQHAGQPTCTWMQTSSHREGRQHPMHLQTTSVDACGGSLRATPASGSSPVPGRLGKERQAEVIYMRDGIMRLLVPTAREAGIVGITRTDILQALRRGRRYGARIIC